MTGSVTTSRHAGQRYIVTGGGSGIGAAVCRLLTSEGARVAAVDTNFTQVERGDIQGGSAEFSIHADVGDERSMALGFQRCLDLLGGVDGVHLNAGVAGRPTRLADVSGPDFETVLRVNVFGVLFGLQNCERAAAGGVGPRSVVVTASVAGLGGSPLYAPYSASKHAVIGLVRTAALEWARDGVRVNAVCPGEILTPMLEDAVRAGSRPAASSMDIPIGRIGSPYEVAHAVSWLLSDESSYVTGAALAVDGGVTAGRFLSTV